MIRELSLRKMNQRQERSDSESGKITLSCSRCGRDFEGHATEAEDSICPRCLVVLNPNAAVDVKRVNPKRHAQMRVRKTRIREDVEEPDWEPLEGEDENQRQEITEFVQIDPEDAEKARLKKISKKRLPDHWEKLALSLRLALVAIVIAGTAVLIVITTKRGVEVARKDVDEAGQPKETRDIDAEVASVVVSEEESEACLEILSSFLEARSTPEKLSRVRVPDRVKPMIETAPPDSDLHTIRAVVMSRKLPIGDRVFLLLAVEIESDNPLARHRFLAFEKTEDGILLDWEVSFRHRQMPLEEFQTSKPTRPVPFRVKIEPANIYDPPFDDQERYLAVALTYPGDRKFRLLGYIDRQTVWGAGLIATLEFESPSMILNLRFPENAVSDMHVEVTGVEHDSWYY